MNWSAKRKSHIPSVFARLDETYGIGDRNGN